MRTAFGTRFDVPDGYLNTASVGIPPEPVVREVADAVQRWGGGRSSPGDFDEAVQRSRTAAAQLLGVPAERVAVGATTSQLVGLVAAGLEPGSSVLTARGEFTFSPIGGSPGVHAGEETIPSGPGLAEPDSYS